MTKKYRHSLWKSFYYAYSGIRYGIKHERNIRLHMVMACVVIGVGLYLSLQTWEWITILLTVGIVLTLECLNTAIETVVDLVTEEYHPLAKIAKDVAAGAVLIFSIIAVIIGLLIFGPKMGQLF